MTHLERDGAPSRLRSNDPHPGPSAVWCGAAVVYADVYPCPDHVRVTNTTTDPSACDCPECLAAVRREMSGG